MTWLSFMNFWIMREMYREDAIMRNYDLLKFTGQGDLHLMHAMKRIGMDGSRLRKWADAENFVPEVAAMIVSYGAPERPEYWIVRGRLIAWYTWDRIRLGEMTQWFKHEHMKGKK